MIYCFDLDGTLCHTEGSDYMNSIPMQERIDVVNRLFDEGNTILIDTARGAGSGINWLDETKEQLAQWDVKYHKLRVRIKFHADIFIDDKGISDKDFFREIDSHETR